MTFRSPFNVSLNSWSTGPNLSVDGKMSYNWARIAADAGYYKVTAEGPTLGEITTVNATLGRYYASSSGNLPEAGHTFNTTAQARGVSVDEAVSFNDGTGGLTYWPNSRSGATASRLMLFAFKRSS